MNRATLLAQGAALHRAGRLDEAARAYEAVLKASPRDPDALHLLGVVAYQRGDYAGAIERIGKAVKHGASEAAVHVNLGAAYRGAGRMTDAVKEYERALRKDPNAADAHNNLGNALMQMGDAPRARTHLERALALSGNALDVASNLLYATCFDGALSARAVVDAHVAWGHSLPSVPTPPKHARAPGAPLRVGLVSADLRTHSVAFFLLPLLRALDPARVRAIAFSCGVRRDATTERLQALPGEWHDLAGLDTQSAAAVIRAAAIDVLVDLGGHTAGSRLDVFALRPVPRQVSWLGYPATTGLGAIGFRLTDDVADPDDAGAAPEERLVRLPGGFLCFEPWPDAPDVAPLPAPRAQRITFGCFNNLAKVGDASLDLFAAVLARVKDAHLLLKAAPLRDAGVRIRLVAALEARGVSKHRVRFLPEDATIRAHLARYAEVDVALDTFPYGGTTTTFEATWMGVPTVTRAGDRHASRVGASILTRLGHPELVAHDADAYVAAAAAIAEDLPRLAALRARLRAELMASPLTDASRFARAMEGALAAIDAAP